MPNLRDLDLNQRDLANLCGHLTDKCARWAMLTDPAFRGMELNNCIMATRIGVEVMKHYGVRNARPEAVECVVGNSQYRQLLEQLGHPPRSREELAEWQVQGAVNIGCSSKAGAPVREGHWMGHLIVLAENILLDLSLDQFNRPQHGIELETAYSEVSMEFIDGRERAVLVHDSGCVIFYSLEPWNDDWKTAPDWVDHHTYQHIIDAIIGEIDAMKDPTPIRSTA